MEISHSGRYGRSIWTASSRVGGRGVPNAQLLGVAGGKLFVFVPVCRTPAQPLDINQSDFSGRAFLLKKKIFSFVLEHSGVSL